MNYYKYNQENPIFVSKNKAMILKKIILSILVLLITTQLFAGTGKVDFIECTVDLQPSGKAVIGYCVRYTVVEGELHGFYFSGLDRLEIESFSDKNYAIDKNGNRFDLSISNVGGKKYDIVLANGKGIGSGYVTYFFWFETNFSSAGYLGTTTSENGKNLVYFDWAPTEWDSDATGMHHYTLKILTPFKPSFSFNVRERVYADSLIMTEKWMNEKYEIDFQIKEAGRLMMLVNKNTPEYHFSPRVQIYMPAAWFDTSMVREYQIRTDETSNGTQKQRACKCPRKCR
ncbi:MAG: hypothetical protein AB7V36_09785 [Bacteroidales bacterium]